MLRPASMRRRPAHALLHLARHIIVAHDSAAVAQATGLSLHHEHPESVTGLRHQGAPCLLRQCRLARARMGGIERPQPCESLFQRSPHSSERSGLLLSDLIVENVDGSAMKAKIAGHGLCIAPHGTHAQRCALLQRLLALSSGGCRWAFWALLTRAAID